EARRRSRLFDGQVIRCRTSRFSHGTPPRATLQAPTAGMLREIRQPCETGGGSGRQEHLPGRRVELAQQRQAGTSQQVRRVRVLIFLVLLEDPEGCGLGTIEGVLRTDGCGEVRSKVATRRAHQGQNRNRPGWLALIRKI